MKRLHNKLPKNLWKILQGNCVIMLLMTFWLGGCSIWNAYLDPDYKSTRADRLCHPYGECSQGTWVTGTGKDATVAKVQCQEAVDRSGNGWWADSVARGLEIGRCMEKQGFTLQQ